MFYIFWNIILPISFFADGKNSAKRIILFDGRCGFCSRSIRILRALDWMNKLEPKNYHDPDVRSRYAPAIALEDLQRWIHVIGTDGTITRGFYAFRSMTWVLPLCWILLPILYIPGVPWVGERVYGWVARHR